MSVAHCPDLQPALAHLDRLLEREVLRLRARYRLSLDEFRGLYITDEQVDHLVSADRLEKARTTSDPAPPSPPLHPVQASRLARFSARLGLGALEVELLLLGLAPELDLKYETVFAYLNDDAGRRWPTVDLACRVCDSAGRGSVLAALAAAAPLARLGIMRSIEPPTGRPSILNSGFALAPGVVQYLLGSDAIPPELVGVVDRWASVDHDPVLPFSPALAGRIARLPEVLAARSDGSRPLIFLSGPLGSGAQHAAGVTARALGYELCSVDLDQARTRQGWPEQTAAVLALHIRLRQTAALVQVTWRPEHEAELTLVLRRLHATGLPVFVVTESASDWRELRRSLRSLSFELGASDFNERRMVWDAALSRANLALPPAAQTALAGRFDLSPVQVELALSAALDLGALADAPPDWEALISLAARGLLEQQLGRLASKVTLKASWTDLVLPKATESRLRELAAAVRFRPLVYGEWGFGRRSGSGHGIKALFAGPSGTGKTMTAAVLARELGFDLYRIDLSGIVSKYIGETEKNLDEIFRGARAGHALLFFDEADALFGKRSEVKDAHDRYANIEVSYLLQKLEDHDGVVILATNLKRNIDDAFARRMHYVIDFPMPDASAREALWRGMFPTEAPLGADVDFGFLARQFALPGGDIRNVALDAAFLAAQNTQEVTMKELVRATARQLVKQGRLPSPSEFQQYHGWVCEGI